MTDPTPPVPLDPGPGPVDVTPPPEGVPGTPGPGPGAVTPTLIADGAAQKLLDGLAILASLVERFETLLTLVPQVSTLIDRFRNLAAPPVLGDLAEPPPDPAGPVIHPDAQASPLILALQGSLEGLVQRAKEATDEKIRAPLLKRAAAMRERLASVIAGEKA